MEFFIATLARSYALARVQVALTLIDPTKPIQTRKVDFK